MKRILLSTFILSLLCLCGQAQINLTDYNVSFSGGDGNTNAIELNKALQDAATSGKSLYIPKGTISLNGIIHIPSGVHISGSGVNTTKLHWENSYSGDGLVGDNFSIENIYLIKQAANAKSAIRCNSGTFVAKFVQIINKWDKAFDINNCDSVEIGNCRPLGSSIANIYISNSSNIIIRDTHSRAGHTGILVENTCSNITIKTISCTAEQYGIRFNTETVIDNVLMEGGDISGCYVNSILLNNVTNANIKYMYGVVRQYEGADIPGVFQVTGSKSENITFNSCNTNSVNNIDPISGIRIDEGNNIYIKYPNFSGGTNYPIVVKKPVTNVRINGINGGGSVTQFVYMEAPENVTIEKYNKYSVYPPQ